MVLSKDAYTNRGYQVLCGHTLQRLAADGRENAVKALNKYAGTSCLKEGLVGGTAHSDDTPSSLSEYLNGPHQLPPGDRVPRKNEVHEVQVANEGWRQALVEASR
jgi:hypothetical protein